jgi:hypothetical protein
MLVWWRGRLWRQCGGSLRAPLIVPAPPTESIVSGALLTVYVKGVAHEGIAVDASNVVHKSQRRGKVVIEPLARFSAKRPIYVGEVVGGVENAVARVGEAWTPVRNCQRFVAECSGRKRRSRDADKAAMVVGAAMVAGSLLTRG